MIVRSETVSLTKEKQSAAAVADDIKKTSIVKLTSKSELNDKLNENQFSTIYRVFVSKEA